MFHPVAKFYEPIFKTVNNDQLVLKINEKLASISEEEYKKAAINHPRSGVTVFYKNDDGDEILEIIFDTKGGDCVVAIYEPNAIFSDTNAYVNARIELMEAIAKYMDVPYPDPIEIKDESRGRNVRLRHLTTAQLIDLLHESDRRIQLL